MPHYYVKKEKKALSCSFCGKEQSEVFKLIAGPKVWICDECTELCQGIIDEARLDDSQTQISIDESELELKAETLIYTLRKYANNAKFKIVRVPDEIANIPKSTETKP